MSSLYVGEIAQCIKEAYAVNPRNCIMLWGPPGIGKTQAVEAAAVELKEEYGTFDIGIYITSQMESIDFAMPVVINDEETGLKTYIKLPIRDFILKKGTRKIIFFDELPNAAPDVQKAAQSILTDRKIHEVKLPDEVIIIAAGNYKEDRAGSNGLLSALANRLEHYDVKASFDDWENWALRKGIHHAIVSYLKMSPKNLHHFNPKENRNPTPRVWEALSHYMHYYDKVATSSPLVRRRMESRLGPSIAGEFMEHMRCFTRFPTKEEIKKDPQKAKLPSEGDVQYALMIACLNWLEKENAKQMIDYVLRMNKEFQGAFFTQAKKLKSDCLVGQKEFTNWATKNLNLLRNS